MSSSIQCAEEAMRLLQLFECAGSETGFFQQTFASISAAFCGMADAALPDKFSNMPLHLKY